MIRNLSTADYEEFCRVRLQSLEQYPVAYSSMPQFFREASREMKMSLLVESESESSSFIKGLFQGTELIGMIGLRRETRESVAHKASLWGFYVNPLFQGKGYGRDLLQSLIETATDDKNLRNLRLMASVSCETAIRLFRGFGFEQYGLEPMSISDGEKFFDQAYFWRAVGGEY